MCSQGESVSFIRPAGKNQADFWVPMCFISSFIIAVLYKVPGNLKFSYNQVRPAGPVHHAEVSLGIDSSTQAGGPLASGDSCTGQEECPPWPPGMRHPSRMRQVLGRESRCTRDRHCSWGLERCLVPSSHHLQEKGKSYPMKTRPNCARALGPHLLLTNGTGQPLFFLQIHCMSTLLPSLAATNPFLRNQLFFPWVQASRAAS